MALSWNEIRSRAITFTKEWENESRENAESQSFWNDFFDVFGMRSMWQIQKYDNLTYFE